MSPSGVGEGMAIKTATRSEEGGEEDAEAVGVPGTETWGVVTEVIGTGVLATDVVDCPNVLRHRERIWVGMNVVSGFVERSVEDREGVSAAGTPCGGVAYATEKGIIPSHS